MSTFTEKEIDRVLEALQRAVEQEGSQRRAAQALNMTQQHISRLLRSPRHPQDRPGIQVARSLAEYFVITVEELLSGEPPEVGPRLRELHGWQEARREAQARMPALRDGWMDLIGEIRHPRPPPLTADFLASLAMTWATAAASQPSAPSGPIRSKSDASESVVP